MRIKNIVKRDGRIKPFEFNRIMEAIEKAYVECEPDGNSFYEDYSQLAKTIKSKLETIDEESIDVETVQDIVVDSLKLVDKLVASAYQEYRERREEDRIRKSSRERFYTEVLECSNVDNDNANVNQYSFSGRKYRIADYEQKMYALRNLISPEGRKAFEEGLIYYHDLSSYAIGDFNCMNLDIGKGLSKGFKTRNGDVRPAGRYSSACQLVAVMFQCQSHFGSLI